MKCVGVLGATSFEILVDQLSSKFWSSRHRVRLREEVQMNGMSEAEDDILFLYVSSQAVSHLRLVSLPQAAFAGNF
jgi:hypothetical protein